MLKDFSDEKEVSVLRHSVIQQEILQPRLKPPVPPRSYGAAYGTESSNQNHTSWETSKD